MCCEDLWNGNHFYLVLFRTFESSVSRVWIGTEFNGTELQNFPRNHRKERKKRRQRLTNKHGCLSSGNYWVCLLIFSSFGWAWALSSVCEYLVFWWLTSSDGEQCAFSCMKTNSKRATQQQRSFFSLAQPSNCSGRPLATWLKFNDEKKNSWQL